LYMWSSCCAVILTRLEGVVYALESLMLGLRGIEKKEGGREGERKRRREEEKEKKKTEENEQKMVN
jgi:hypothetical protein